MREEEGVESEEEQVDQVGDQVEDESGSSVYLPLVREKTGHHWVLEQLCARVVYLRSGQ